MAVRKKQDDSNLKILRELVTNGGNRQCFDCGQKGPTYANITIGSFVCTRCSGVLRGLTPPHRVKSISMATFTPEEIEFLKSHGNDDCAKTWLGLWDPKRTVHQDQRELMIDKYERKRYYLEPASPLKSLTNAATSKLSSSSSLSSSSVSSLSAASNNISNSNNNINMTNGYTYLNDNNNINNNNNNNINNNIINNNHNKISNFNSSNLINNGHHHQNSNGILAPPSPKHHNVSTTSSSSLSSSTGGVQQNGFNGTTVYHRPHSNSYYQQQQQQQQQLKQNGYSNGLKSNKIGGSSLITNGFTPDSDFVADFSSAQIFNATNGNDSTNRIKSQHNDNTENNNNGINNNNGMNNVFGSPTVGVNENFADFEHAPIYNAVGMPTTMNSNNNFALNSSSNSATTLKSNTTGNSAPSADRYAALKDLDEQLRETKTLSGPPISSVFASTDNLNNSSTINNANPFKTVQSMSGNPFQTNGNLSYNVNGTNGSLFDTSSSQQFQVQQQQSNGFAANTNFGIFNNNYNNNINNNIGNGFNGYNNLTSNGIQQQQQQQSIIGGSYATMKNPFVTTSSNNPFL